MKVALAQRDSVTQEAYKSRASVGLELKSSIKASAVTPSGEGIQLVGNEVSITLQPATTPVSYTHLDVYKRQSYNGSVSFSKTQKRYDVLSGDEYRSYANQLWGDKLPSDLGTANTDWQDQIFRTAVSTDHHVSINGGFKNLPYRVSLGYTDDNGIVKTSNFRRFTASVNLSLIHI